MPTINDLDITKPDGATEAVAVLDNYIRELKEALRTSYLEEHSLLGPHKFLSGNSAARPAAAHAGRIYINTELKTVQLDDGAAWASLIHYNNRVKIGTFTGTGAGQSITGVGFQPTYLKVIPLTGTNPSFECGVNHAAGDSHKDDDMTTSTTGITLLSADGFTVGVAASVNLIVYQYIAMRDRA